MKDIAEMIFWLLAILIIALSCGGVFATASCNYAGKGTYQTKMIGLTCFVETEKDIWVPIDNWRKP